MRKKLDSRIRTLIEHGVANGHRSMLVIVGDKSRDQVRVPVLCLKCYAQFLYLRAQVPIVHHILAKATITSRPTILWCYKKELEFSSHRKKRMRQLQKKIKSGKFNVNEEDPFDLFVSSTEIRYAYYHETHTILGNTYGMCVLQVHLC